jgi:drug/metabolite transporter (DMT)-like permease
VVALATAWLTLGERPNAWQLVGSGIVLAGVTLAQLRR